MVKKKDISSAAALLGSKGGKKSSSNMTPEERSERGRKAIAKRWENAKAVKEKK
jgi:hypothetical protein